MDLKRSTLRFSREETVHRRGNYAAKGYGISYGGGQLKPANLAHGAANRAALKALVEHEAFKRLAGFASGRHSFS